MELIGAMMWFGILFLVIILGLVIFWMWMLVDLLQRKKFEDKLVWVMVLIFLNVLGAILYYSLVYARKR